jgi:hypothetical protein
MRPYWHVGIWDWREEPRVHFKALTFIGQEFPGANRCQRAIVTNISNNCSLTPNN